MTKDDKTKLFSKEIAEIFLLSETPHDKIENADEEREKQRELKNYLNQSNSRMKIRELMCFFKFQFFKINIIFC